MKKVTGRRQRLLEADPHCYWCGREVVEWVFESGVAPPLNQATIDHVNSRVRGPRPKIGRWVLACRECNEGRAREEEAELGIEELRRRSRRPEK